MDSQITIILITIIFSAFFSGMEIAFVSSNKIYLEIEKKQNNFFSNILKKITQSPSKFIATMLVGNNISLVVYGLYSGKLILKFFFPEINSSESLDFIYIFYQTLISTFVILITAEFLPKVLADRSTIVVVDKKGDTKGYITEKELAISLNKNSHNEFTNTN